MIGISLQDIIRSQGSVKLKAVKLIDHLIGGLIARSLPRRTRAQTVALNVPLRWLVIRPGGIGDAVLLLPILRALKKEGHHVDVLCERRNAAVFSPGQEVCDALLRYDAGSELLAVFQRPYDVVVDTEQWHHLSAVIARFLKSRLTVGFASRPSRARLFDIAVPYKMNEHELDSFARLFQAAGLEQPPDLRRSFQIIASDAAWARDAVAGDYVVLALGASIMLRRFTLPQAESVCRAALERGFQVVLLGGMDVAALARQVMDRIKDPRVLHYAGRTSLSQTAAMIAGARRFIGHDTGLLHLACAVGTPVTGVFGPGNKFKWGPRGPDDRVISFNLSCSPCTRFGYTLPVCGGGYACVRKVAMDQASVS